MDFSCCKPALPLTDSAIQQFLLGCFELKLFNIIWMSWLGYFIGERENVIAGESEYFQYWLGRAIQRLNEWWCSHFSSFVVVSRSEDYLFLDWYMPNSKKSFNWFSIKGLCTQYRSTGLKQWRNLQENGCRWGSLFGTYGLGAEAWLVCLVCIGPSLDAVLSWCAHLNATPGLLNQGELLIGHGQASECSTNHLGVKSASMNQICCWLNHLP